MVLAGLGLNLYLFFQKKTFQLTALKVYVIKLWQYSALEAVCADDLDVSVTRSGVIGKVQWESLHHRY